MNSLLTDLFDQYMGTQTGTTNPDQSEPGNNDNEGVLNTPQISRTTATLSNTIPRTLLLEGFTPLQGTISVL